MAAIFQTTFSNAFSWMTMLEFRLRFDWSLFPRVQLSIFQHWFRYWLGADQATSHYLNQWWLFYRRIYASLGLNELFKQPCLKYELRDSYRLEQPKFNTFTYGLRSFRYYGSKLWNVLRFSLKNTKELHVFKKNITEWCHSTQRRSFDVFWHSDCIDVFFLTHFSNLSSLCDIAYFIFIAMATNFTQPLYTFIYMCRLCHILIWYQSLWF